MLLAMGVEPEAPKKPKAKRSSKPEKNSVQQRVASTKPQGTVKSGKKKSLALEQ